MSTTKPAFSERDELLAKFANVTVDEMLRELCASEVKKTRDHYKQKMAELMESASTADSAGQPKRSGAE